MIHALSRIINLVGFTRKARVRRGNLPQYIGLANARRDSIAAYDISIGGFHSRSTRRNGDQNDTLSGSRVGTRIRWIGSSHTRTGVASNTVKSSPRVCDYLLLLFLTSFFWSGTPTTTAAIIARPGPHSGHWIIFETAWYVEKLALSRGS